MRFLSWVIVIEVKWWCYALLLGNRICPSTLHALVAEWRWGQTPLEGGDRDASVRHQSTESDPVKSHHQPTMINTINSDRSKRIPVRCNVSSTNEWASESVSKVSERKGVWLRLSKGGEFVWLNGIDFKIPFSYFHIRIELDSHNNYYLIHNVVQGYIKLCKRWMGLGLDSMDGWTAFMLMGARLLIRFDSVLQQWRTWTGAGRRGRGDGHDEMSEGTWQNGWKCNIMGMWASVNSAFWSIYGYFHGSQPSSSVLSVADWSPLIRLHRDGQSETVSLDGLNYIIRNVKGLF